MERGVDFADPAATGFRTAIVGLWGVFKGKNNLDDSHPSPKEVADYFEHTPSPESAKSDPVIFHVSMCSKCLEELARITHMLTE